MKLKKKAVLAYSGGLDTSFVVNYLTNEKKMDVYTVIVNTGGFSKIELSEIEKKAYELGSKKHKTIDITQTYYQKCVKYMIFGNILKNNSYPLSVSSERTFQAIETAKYAKEVEADFIVHGSTSAGNDQIRFDTTFAIFIPEIKIISPVREMSLSREDEIKYLKDKGIELDWSKTEYSINKGLWGTSIGGKETLESEKSLPEYAYPSQLTAEKELNISLRFEKGEPTSIDNQGSVTNFNNPEDAIIELEKIASKFACGRGIHIGDTILGIKGRVGFEASAPIIIIEAHRTLEKHVLSANQIYQKDAQTMLYGRLLHEAQFLDPVMRDIEAYLESSQRLVNGTVFIKLKPYTFEIEGINSEHDLMDNRVAEYGEKNKMWTHDDVLGFTKIFSIPQVVYNKINNDVRNW